MMLVVTSSEMAVGRDISDLYWYDVVVEVSGVSGNSNDKI